MRVWKLVIVRGQPSTQAISYCHFLSALPARREQLIPNSYYSRQTIYCCDLNSCNTFFFSMLATGYMISAIVKRCMCMVVFSSSVLLTFTTIYSHAGAPRGGGMQGGTQPRAPAFRGPHSFPNLKKMTKLMKNEWVLHFLIMTL